MSDEPTQAEEKDEEPPYHPKFGVKHREWNRVEGWIGRPKWGKTEAMIATALDWQKRYRAYVIVHDLGWKIPPQTYDGKATGAQYHRTVEEARKAILSKGGGMHCISSPDGHGPLALAREIGEMSLQRSKCPGWGFPVILMVDEVITSNLANRQNVDDDMRLLISDRRHAHVAILWGVQHIRYVNAGLVSLSTKVHVANFDDEFSKSHLMKCGLQDDFVNSLSTVQKHQFATARIG